MGALSQKNGPKRKRGRRNHAAAILFIVFAATVCLYLARLEAHTRADIFLPTDYHAVLRASGPQQDIPGLSDADAAALLNDYYQRYATQEGRPYTIRQDILLSRLAYIRAPEGFRGETDGVTVLALCDEAQRIARAADVDTAVLPGRSRQEILDITTGIREHANLGALTIREYITSESGLAGYVLQGDGEITITFRGTETTADMLDNVFLLPFNLSMQYDDVRGLLARYGDAARIWLTGHSKGGHNAIYAASIDPRCRATGFNAPGFGIFLSDAQHDGLDHGVNYVINGDVTGFLLFHLERRIVLESIDPAAPGGQWFNRRHRLDNFFSIDGLTVATRISPLAIASEWVTQIVWLLLIFLAAYGIIRLLKRLWDAALTWARRASEKPEREG